MLGDGSEKTMDTLEELKVQRVKSDTPIGYLSLDLVTIDLCYGIDLLISLLIIVLVLLRIISDL